MADSPTDLRTRVAALVQLSLEPPALLRELDAIAGSPDFTACADIWALALYQRDATYFEYFLLRHLDESSRDAIIAILPRAEADSRAALFQGLYPLITDEEGWNRDLLALANATMTDEEFVRAVTWRTLSFALSEEVAVAVYRRAPIALAMFVQEHAIPGYIWAESRRRTYSDLRQAVQAQGNEDLAWYLFRRFALPLEWAAEARQLIERPIPGEKIVAELEKRQLESNDDVDTSLFLSLLNVYGVALIPYLDRHFAWLGYQTPLTLLDPLEKLGAISLYRRIFFTFSTPEAWNEKLQSLLANPSDDILAATLPRWTPPLKAGSQQWWLKDEIALKLYQRDHQRFGAFVAAHIHEPTRALFDAAEANGDEQMLDHLSARLLEQLSTLITYVPVPQRKTGMLRVGKRITSLLHALGERVVQRFARLAAQDPAIYVTHAASILGEGIGLAWYLHDDLPHNPFAYIRQQQRDAWLGSATAIRSLLDRSDPIAIGFGFSLLEIGSTVAAMRTSENASLLNAILLNNKDRKLRQRALRVLVTAAQSTPEAASRILPMLEEAIYYRSEQAIDEAIMVGFVRARHTWSSQTATA
jgi:hypothetical protein